MSSLRPSLRADHPLCGPAEDLLGFEPLADALASLIESSSDTGLLASVHAAESGAGRTSYLALLHAALRSRGIACVRLDADRAPELAGALVPPDGRGAPVLLLDDACEADVQATLGEAPTLALVAAWEAGAPAPEHFASPLVIQLPRWDDVGAERLAERLADEDEARAAWRAMLRGATTPRAAWRLVNEARLAMALRPPEAAPWPSVEIAGGPRLVAPGAALPPRSPRRRATDEAPSAERLVEQMRDPSPKTRASACAALPRALGREAIPALGLALRDPQPRVRLAAENALRAALAAAATDDDAGGGDLPADIAATLALLACDGSEILREPALDVLRAHAAVSALAALMHDDRADVRRAAATALGRLGDSRAVEPLLQAHSAEDAELRRTAAASLVRLGYGAG